MPFEKIKQSQNLPSCLKPPIFSIFIRLSKKFLIDLHLLKILIHLFFIDVQLIYNAPGVQKSDSVTHIHICMCMLLFTHLSHILLFVTPWTAAHQAPLSSTVSQSLLKFVSIESVMLSNHLILCHPLLLLPSIFPSIKVFPMSQLFASGKP